MAQSPTKQGAQFLFTVLFFDVLRFPVWWYTTGLLRAFRFFGQEAAVGAESLSLILLFRNLLKPMYGDYTKTGRIISFFLRIILFAVRLVLYFLWLVLLLLFIVIWITLPPLTFYLFIRTLL